MGFLRKTQATKKPACLEEGVQQEVLVPVVIDSFVPGIPADRALVFQAECEACGRWFLPADGYVGEGYSYCADCCHW